jgi:hypothetical protein
MIELTARKTEYERLDKIVTVRLSNAYQEMLDAAEKIPELRNRDTAYLIRYAIEQTYGHLVESRRHSKS